MNRINIRLILIPSIIFVLLSVFLSFLYISLEQNQDKNRIHVIQSDINVLLNLVEIDIDERIQSLNRIVNRWEIRGGTPKNEFIGDVQAYIIDDPGYQAIEWVDNNFHVRWIVPFSGNEKAENLNLAFEENRRIALEDARDLKNPTLTSPIDLVQGGKGVLVYNPIYIDKNFEGFILAVFRTQEWLGTLISKFEKQDDITHSDYKIIIDETLVYVSDEWNTNNNTHYIEKLSLDIYEHSFTIYIKPTEQFIEESQSLIPELVFIFGILFSALISIIIYLLEKTLEGQMKFKIEIEEHKETEILLAKERERLSYILEGTNVGTWEWNVQTGEILINKRWAETIGYSKKEISPLSIQSWDNFTNFKDLETSALLREKNFTGVLDYYECETRMKHKDGRWVWVLDKGKVVTWASDGKPLLMCGTHQDISERKKAEEIIQNHANHDSLTSLPNLRVVRDRIYLALEMAKRERLLVAIMFVDLDGFKKINDDYGHDAGDYLLKEVASRLLSCIRKVDTVARIGGDEFLMIITSIKQVRIVDEIAVKTIKLISHPVCFKDKTLNVGASIGISIFPDDGHESNILIKRADKAMYEVKKSGKNSYSYYEKHKTVR